MARRCGMTWDESLNAYRASLLAAGRPQTTIKLRSHQLRRLSTTYPDPWTITTDQLIDWLASHQWAPETRRSHRAAVVHFFAWAEKTGRVPHSPAADLPSVRRGHHRPRPTPDKVYRAALGHADARVQLMLRLGALEGLRRAEISRIHARDLLEDLLGWSLLVHGKGGKDRMVPLADDLAAELREVCAGGWAFPGKDGGHLSAPWVGRLLSRALGPGWSGHTLRHRFGTRVYAASGDLLSLQQLLGHSSPATTRQYVALSDEALRRAAAAAA